MKKIFLLLAAAWIFLTFPAHAEEPVKSDAEIKAAMEAQREDLQRAALQIFNTIQKIRRNLLDQIAFYSEGRSESDIRYMFTQLMSAKPSEKLLQAPGRFGQGVTLAAESWPQLPALAELREYYIRSFNGFGKAAALEIEGYQSGPLFWEVNSKLDKANQLKDIAFQDAETAMVKTGEMLVKIGMYKESSELETLDKDIEELQRRKFEFLISGREIQGR